MEAQSVSTWRCGLCGAKFDSESEAQTCCDIPLDFDAIGKVVKRAAQSLYVNDADWKEFIKRLPKIVFLARMASELEDVKKDRASVVTELERALQTIQLHQTDISKLKEDVTFYRNAVKGLEATVKEAEDDRTRIFEQLQASQAELGNAHDRVKRIAESHGKLRRWIDRLQEVVRGGGEVSGMLAECLSI